MAIEIIEVSTGNVLGINDDGQARVILYDASGNPIVRADGATVPASSQSFLPVGGYNETTARALRTGALGGVALNRVNRPLFQDLIDGGAVNAQLWTQTLTTMTVAQANRVVTMNAGNSVAANAVAAHTSLAQYSKVRESVQRLSTRMRFAWNAPGAVMQVGFAVASAAVEQIVNGVFFRITTAGALELVYASSSADVVVQPTGVSIGTGAGNLNPGRWYDVDLYVFDDGAQLLIHASDGIAPIAPVVDASIGFTLAQPVATVVRALPVLFRILNVSAPATASQLFYGSTAVLEQDLDEARPVPHALARVGRNTTANPATGVQLANYANSAAPVSATLSNTAAGYTTLGGQWQFAAPAGAETDFALFAFAVPTGYTLVISDLQIDTFNLGAAVATTAHLLQWFMSRSTAVTLASGTLRKTLGVQSLPVGTPIGGAASSIRWHGDAPFVVDSGLTFHLGLKIPVGTATGGQIIRGVASVEGYLE